ncbi:uncharacterized protein [Montipora capricornis]|uniref:uncharacterized protein isoform X2 n=1 Tax=Montipora capricornis TaxID=246305 RepID=UPI0035F1D0B9
MFLSRFPFRLIRQSWTKSYSTVSVKEVEALKKKAFFYSVHLKRNNHIVNMLPPGFPLSSATLNVSKGPSIEFAKLAPSLFEFLETVTTNDRRDDGPKWEAFEVLENALQVLTSKETPLGLTSELIATLNGLRLNTMKSNTEEAVNLAIVNLILKHLTRAYFILNKSHSKVFKPSKRLFMPESLLWDGLALGHRFAWYGELDMLIFPFITEEAGSKVALLGEKMPPWRSKTQPKLLYENESVQALWDVPVYADSIEVRANRIDSRIVDKEQKRVLDITEMSCPWLDNCEVRDMEKTQKYGPLMWELRERNPDHQVNQCNIIIDVLGGYSADRLAWILCLMKMRREAMLKKKMRREAMLKKKD